MDPGAPDENATDIGPTASSDRRRGTDSEAEIIVGA
jgi:hypothetical protein